MIERVQRGKLITAERQNDLIDQVNQNTEDIAELLGQVPEELPPHLPSTNIPSVGTELVRRAVDGVFVRGFDPGTNSVWVPFYGPESGGVTVSVSAQRQQTIALSTWIGWEIREGFLPGEGAIVRGAHKTRSAVGAKLADSATISGEFHVSAIWPGQPYHARLMWASEQWAFPATGVELSLLTRQISVTPSSAITAEEVQERIEEAIEEHRVAPTPHLAYDDMPSLKLIFENGLV